MKDFHVVKFQEYQFNKSQSMKHSTAFKSSIKWVFDEFRYVLLWIKVPDIDSDECQKFCWMQIKCELLMKVKKSLVGNKKIIYLCTFSS